MLEVDDGGDAEANVDAWQDPRHMRGRVPLHVAICQEEMPTCLIVAYKLR